MITSITASVFIGALLWMDREYALQIQISRPVVVSAILGLILGNIHIALMIGVSLEIIGLYAPPVGGYLPYDENFCAVVALPVASVAAQTMENLPAAGFTLVLCLPSLIVGRKMNSYIMKRNENIIEGLGDDWLSKIDYLMIKSLLKIYIKVLLITAICVLAFSAIAWFITPLMPEKTMMIFSYMPVISVMIGLAGLVVGKRMHSRYSWAGAFILGISAAVLWKLAS
jgi:mannose/fructose/N-acetylgalactosamine-specific phosphotransferase system component IIC